MRCEYSFLLDESHVAFRASAWFFLHHFWMMRTGVLMRVIARELVLRLLATDHADAGSTERQRHQCWRYPFGYLHAAFS
jgi:hypothetical protein